MKTRRGTSTRRAPSESAACDSDAVPVTISSHAGPENGWDGAGFPLPRRAPSRPAGRRGRVGRRRGPSAQGSDSGWERAAKRARLGAIGAIGLGMALGVLAVSPSAVLPGWCVIVAAAIRVASGARYAGGVLQGSARPNWMSWSLWGLTAMVACVAQLNDGAGPEALVTFVLGATPLMVCALAVAKGRAESGGMGLTVGCAAITMVGIVLWQLTANPVLAVLFCIVADLFASLPTLVKAYFDPDGEYPLPYLMSAAAMAVTLLTVERWTFTVYGFPLYMLVVNTAIFSIASFPVASVVRRFFGRRRRWTGSPNRLFDLDRET